MREIKESKILKKVKYMRPARLLLVLALLFAVCSYVSAEVLTYEGVSGDGDKGRRGPVLSVSHSVDSNGATILVDAYTPSSEFTKYPIRFDFFVNRSLYASQLRSTEQPGPIGVTVPASVAQVPFNFAIIATVLHPNRLYTTVAEGRVFTSNLSTTLRCTLNTAASSDSTEGHEYTVENISSSQSDNSSLTLSFTAPATDSAPGATATVNLTTSDNNASGTLTIVEDGAESTSDVSGSVERTLGDLTFIDVSSDSALPSLTCESN